MWNMKNALITVLAGATLATGGTVLVLEQGDTNTSKAIPTPTPTSIIEVVTPSFVPSPEFNVSFEITDEAYIYYVQKGDTLELIAKMFGVSVEWLAEVNEIDIFTDLEEGYKIIIPRGNV